MTTVLDRPTHAPPRQRAASRVGTLLPFTPVLALAPLAVPLARTPFWRDEVATVVAASKTPGALWTMVTHTIDAPMGLYYFLLGPLVRVTADAFWLRLPSLLGAVVATVITIATARRLAGAWAGLLAGLIMVANPVLLYWAGIARAYPLALVATTLATYLLLFTDRPRARTVAAFGLCAVAGIYLHAMSALLFAAIAVALLLPRFRAVRWPFLGALAAAGALALPLLLVMHAQAGGTSWIRLVTTGRLVSDMALIVVGGAELAILAAAGALLTLTRLSGVVVALLLMTVGPFAALAALGTVEHVFLDRYLIFLIPPLALLAALGWSRLPWPALLPVAACVAAVAVYSVTVRVTEPPIDDPGAAAAFIAAHDRPGDVIVYSPVTVRSEIRWYLQRMHDTRVTDIAIPPGTEDSRVPNLYLPELPAGKIRALMVPARRIWWVGFPGSHYNPEGVNTSAEVYASLPQRPVPVSRWFGDLNVSLVEVP